ncbi:hypothetical protein [Citreimonas salinaria]|uniref:Uncharacterized protein n=1 Tax=Citreimonas salinaria TaxID=321339 RepID=A0A1H3NAN4_9RHOB|nr:hypothetical protein [Citreimonas salinaria]SDY85814.1 hypothetical protein SAMN05444340_12216 [Citreimonas salinaria]
MSTVIADLKDAVRATLRADFEPIPSVRANSGKVHLEVWRSRGKRRAVGVELGHDTQVNFWVVRPFGLPKTLPASVERVDKQPKGRLWTDAEGKGANSNLSAYEEFRGNPIARLEVRSIEDAHVILDHLRG